MEEIKILADNGSILFDPYRKMVLVERECRYEVSFEAFIGSDEYVSGYFAQLFVAGGSTINLKEEGGLLGWSIGSTFMDFIDQEHYFDAWHYYLVTFTYDDSSNSWRIELNVDGQDTGLINCGPPHFDPSFYLTSGQVAPGTASMIDRRIRNISYVFAHNNLLFPGDGFAGPGVTFEGDNIVYFNPDPDADVWCNTTFDPMKAACCFRNVTEINRFDTSLSAGGSMHWQRCCCYDGGIDIANCASGAPLCGCFRPECSGCATGGACPPYCGPCDFWPPPCDPCLPFGEGGCANPNNYCMPGVDFTQDASSSISGSMLPFFRTAYDPHEPPGTNEFMLWWGLSQGSGTDLSPHACNLYVQYNLDVQTIFTNDPTGFHQHTCQDCDQASDQGQDISGALLFDFDLPPFGGWPSTRGEGEVTLVNSGHATMNAIAFISCPRSYPVHYTGFDLSPLKDLAYDCTNSDSHSNFPECTVDEANGTMTMTSFIS